MILHWVPFHIGDYLSETALMTLDQRGAYLHLRAVSCRQVPPGTLPNDDAVLARLLSVSEPQWSTLKPHALRGWKRQGKRLINEEICRHHAKALHISEERKKAVGERERRRRLDTDQSSLDPSIDRSIDHLSDIRDRREELRQLSSASLNKSVAFPEQKKSATDTRNKKQPPPNQDQEARAADAHAPMVKLSQEDLFNSFWARWPNKWNKPRAKKIFCHNVTGMDYLRKIFTVLERDIQDGGIADRQGADAWLRDFMDSKRWQYVDR